ncbi:MAG TPA: hypothetical protein VIE43_23125, partial [Thermoanaerobaculia bacterium]|nr:hypothetical protein [Thermoanaerobaculia bacterium]
ETDPEAELQTALAEIRAALEEGRYRAAESLLYAAEASFGAHEEFAPLHERVAEERQEDLEAKARARGEAAAARRATALAAAVAEIQEALGLGEPDAAGILLDRAVVRFGAADALREQWQRLERMRAEAKAEMELIRAAEEKEAEGFFATTQEIAELLARREGQQALQRLHQAVAQFGDRPELVALRKRIAALLLDE